MSGIDLGHHGAALASAVTTLEKSLVGQGLDFDMKVGKIGLIKGKVTHKDGLFPELTIEFSYKGKPRTVTADLDKFVEVGKKFFSGKGPLNGLDQNVFSAAHMATKSAHAQAIKPAAAPVAAAPAPVVNNP